jgi:hypothetical protein
MKYLLTLILGIWLGYHFAYSSASLHMPISIDADGRSSSPMEAQSHWPEHPSEMNHKNVVSL